MNTIFSKIGDFFGNKKLQKSIKIIGYFVLGLFSLALISVLCLGVYFEKNKVEIVGKINTQINENLAGKAKIGSIGYKFLIGFPNVTVVLNEVTLSDSLIAIHKRPVLKAGEIEVRLNVLSLLKKEVNIHKIVINDATIDLFKDQNGISNSNIFKTKKEKPKTANNTTTSIDEVVLKNVHFISENKKGNKFFSFQIQSFKSKISYSGEGWETKISLKTFAKSLAFNVNRGSFVKDKILEGKLAVAFSKTKNQISVATEDFVIGKDPFAIQAHFNLAKGNALFDITIRTKILWKNASNLLANNISSKLNKFGLNLPLQASCVIKGDMNSQGDPEIVVNASVKNDELTTSYAVVKNCSFDGKFTNNYKSGLGYNDANSAIIIADFKGDYTEIPIRIPNAIIHNLEKPVAIGKFFSEYDVVKLKNTIDANLIKFYEGTAKVNLDFNIDIVDLKLHKPHFTGAIGIKNASFYYKHKNITFKNTNLDLVFNEQALLIKNIRFQNNKNSFVMEGRVNNFLNLYYDAPEKMIVNWKIYSPFLDIKQLVEVLSYHDKKATVSKSNSKYKTSNELLQVLNKSKVVLDLKVDKMAFNKIVANNFKLNVLLSNGGLYIKKGSMIGKTGSSANFNAQIVPHKNQYLFKCNLDVKEGEISNFLASFNNFGIKSFSPSNIKGQLSLKTTLLGTLNSKQELLKKSLIGTLNFGIKNGAFVNFEPLKKIEKAAFPNRKLSNITFSDLYANATINGEIIKVKNCKISSNILNIDINGDYSLGNTGTNLGIKIPLRNPKDDYKITDAKAREATRYKGIVVNLLVVDGKDGQTKIKLGKNKQEISQ